MLFNLVDKSLSAHIYGGRDSLILLSPFPGLTTATKGRMRREVNNHFKLPLHHILRLLEILGTNSSWDWLCTTLAESSFLRTHLNNDSHQPWLTSHAAPSVFCSCVCQSPVEVSFPSLRNPLHKVNSPEALYAWFTASLCYHAAIKPIKSQALKARLTQAHAFL